ncbi:FAD-dependent oxidoreductase [Labedella endophytica]|uniref:FAD-dependent oxidoreductase n=1 Tax=Labedella endophytica TaxID=1523160 RepID=A0A433JX25_9MICO|nr:FAD-dependent oxidoreductase [Labedella endophytica]RUR03504.1 FAD-dependent oxidoreductase [Labedella endophytica]
MKSFTSVKADVLIVGGGLGGVSAALALADAGRTVVITEPTLWLGGQLTSQMVPSDEHRHIEWTGASRSYRTLREGIRRYYRDWFPLTDAARADPLLNPGASWVSPIAADPRVCRAVIDGMLAPHVSSGRVTVLTETRPVGSTMDGHRITSVRVTGPEGEHDLEADFFLDASETGDLLDLAGIDHVSGRESRDETGEPSAADTADPLDMQSATWCFAMEHLDGTHTIDKPELYEEFRDLRPAALGGARALSFDGPEEQNEHTFTYSLVPNPDDDPADIDIDHRNMSSPIDLWTYRRVLARNQLRPGSAPSDVTIVNWPMNDYVGGALFGTPDADLHAYRARQMSLSLLYWMQTEAPRPDGGTGWPGLHLRSDMAGTEDGLAMAPYIRESRRIRALHTIREQDVSTKRRDSPLTYSDSVGVGHYFWMDRHASTGGRKGSADVPWPFEIPLGSLVPRTASNVLPAAKNIGTTQITNGSYRLHPVEWSIGEAAGSLAALCLDRRLAPQAVHADERLVTDLQGALRARGVQLHWPRRIQP